MSACHQKGQLIECGLSYFEQETIRELNLIPKEEIVAYLVDFMALISSLLGVSDAYWEITKRNVDTVPTSYERVVIVAGAYKNDSLENSDGLRMDSSPKLS